VKEHHFDDGVGLVDRPKVWCVQGVARDGFVLDRGMDRLISVQFSGFGLLGHALGRIVRQMPLCDGNQPPAI
jgi:hypothetical protein